MPKTGNTTILLMGVSGLALSIAMMLDKRSKSEPELETIPQKQEKIDYAKIYEDSIQKENAPKIIADERYKGDGSTFNKELYFRSRAYKQARETTPIGINHIIDTKMKKDVRKIIERDTEPEYTDEESDLLETILEFEDLSDTD
ncbi:MAG: hypothetical protein K0U52_08415 [Gammaproteobacteria bacterium]|nr:hypothetical protein [Gammaproteobacteria bacterium]